MWFYFLLFTTVYIGGALSDDANCICVPYYMCDKNGKIVSDGNFLIDLRSGPVPLRTVRQAPCGNYVDVCCHLDEEAVVHPASSSGSGNPDEVDFKIFDTSDNAAKFEDFSGTVRIFTKNGRHLCGGSLIHPSVVLTAAQCFKINYKSYVVIASKWNQAGEAQKEQTVDVSSIKIHEDYKLGTLYNDIALIFLKSPFTVKPQVNTITLPPKDMDMISSNCYVQVWERIPGEATIEILKNVKVPYVPRSKCQTELRQIRLGKYFRLHRSVICAGGEEGKDACRGDGGNPLICPMKENKERYQQMGIVSWGILCGTQNIPGVYTNVALFRDWIDKQLARNNLSINV